MGGFPGSSREFTPGLYFPDGERPLLWATRSLSHKDVRLLPVTRSPGVPLPWLCSPFTRLKYGWAPTMQHHCSRPHSLTEPLLMWELGRCQGGKRVSRRKRYFPGAPGRLLLSPYLSRLCAQPPGRRLEGSGENTTTYFPGCGEN